MRKHATILQMLCLLGCAGNGTPVCDPFLEPAPAAAQEDSEHNVLLVIMDDVGVELIGGYGHPNAAPTPTIDGLMADGIRFDQMTSEPWCSPTRAELATGLYSYRFQIGRAIELEAESTSLPPETTSIAELLGERGWSTAVFGKWHLTAMEADALNGPALHGFAHHDGTIGNLSRLTAYDGERQDYRNWENIVNGVVQRETTYATTHTFDRLQEWMAETPEPWFAWVGLHAAHLPWHLPPDHNDADTVGSGTPAKVRAMVTDLDRQLGRVLDGMGPDLRSQTVVIVVGDNGSTDNSAMGEYVGKQMKSHVLEGGIHVPLVIAGPIVASPGRNESSLVALPDLFATIVDLADGDPGAIDGRSLLSVLRDETSSARQWSYATAFEPNGPGPYTAFEQTIRGQRYKLIRDRSGDTLYDLTLSDLEGNDSKVKRKRSVEQWSGYRKILDGCFPRDIK